MGIPISYNLRNLVERKGTTLMTAVGIGLTVAVLVTAMALTAGLKRVFGATGDPRHLIVLRKGASAELTSSVTGEGYQIVRNLPGIALGTEGEPLVSPEVLTVINLPSVDSPEGMNVTVRGLLPVGMSMRPMEITQGKKFEPGLRQVIVGESVARRYPDARLGGRVRFGKGTWDVVGVFRVADTAANSEIWANLDQVSGDFERQGGYNTLLVRAQSGALGTIKAAVEGDQRLNSTGLREKEYYAKMTESGVGLQALGFSVAMIMAIGSAFAATNTMYAAVARRTREIGTLRAIGFGRWAILRSFMLESICLALVGGAVGVLIALPIHGLTTGIGTVTFSEVAFKFRVGPDAVLWGLAFAALIGAVGGFLPAWSASRKGIIAAMRD